MFPEEISFVRIAALGTDAQEEVFLGGNDARFFEQGWVRHVEVRMVGNASFWEVYRLRSEGAILEMGDGR